MKLNKKKKKEMDTLPEEMIYYITDFLPWEDIENLFKALKMEIDLEWKKKNFQEFSFTKSRMISFPEMPNWKIPISYRQTFYVRHGQNLTEEMIERKFEKSGLNDKMRESDILSE